MDLRYTEHEEAFRGELREWLEGVVPALPAKPKEDDWAARRGVRHRLAAHAVRRRVRRGSTGRKGRRPRRHAHRAPHLPRGDRAARAPDVGVQLRRPDARRPDADRRGLRRSRRPTTCPRILNGEHVWCQGFSEPEAGSDLASLRTRAVRDGDEYVSTARRSGPRSATSPSTASCSSAPTPTPEAQGHHLADRADGPARHRRPPARDRSRAPPSSARSSSTRSASRSSNRVGDENDGWRVANVTLSFERGTAFVADDARHRAALRDLVELAKHLTSNGRRLGGRRPPPRPRPHRAPSSTRSGR